MAATSEVFTVRRFVILGVLLIVLGACLPLASAADCSLSGRKCGLPVVYIQQASGPSTTVSADLFSSLRNANQASYIDSITYYVFYDSRSGQVNFQDANGLKIQPGVNARNFVMVWHDGSSTDWRYMDATLAARVPATAKADELARIAWAIKTATSTPRVIVAGSSLDLLNAHYYVAGKAAPQFGGATEPYNNDFQGILATDPGTARERANQTGLQISTILQASATDQYVGKNAMVAASTVNIVNGISSSSNSVSRGQSLHLTSNMGPVVWSVLEGPSVGTVDKNGVFTAAVSKGNAHVVAVSQVNHALVAVSTLSLATTASPVVTTKAVSAINAAGGTFNGTVNPNGASGTAGFVYSLNSSFNPAAGTTTVAVSGSTTVPFSVVQTRLTKATKYYVRAFFLDGSTHVTTYGATVSFTVTNSFVTTTNASKVTSSDATLNGTYNAGGFAGYVVFAYSSNNFTTTYYSAHINVAGDFTTHTISATVSKLQTAKAYKYKAYFVQNGNASPVQSGAAVGFTTANIFVESDQPNWVINITQHGATFPGKYGSGGGPAEVWIEISTSPTFAGGASVYNPIFVPSGVFAAQSVNISVSTLNRNTTYYFRYAIRNTENGFTYRYPTTYRFTTLP